MSTVTFLLAAVLLLGAALVAVSVLAVRQSRRARHEAARARIHARHSVDNALKYASLLTSLPHDHDNEIVRKADKYRAELLGKWDIEDLVAYALDESTDRDEFAEPGTPAAAVAVATAFSEYDPR